VNFCAGAAVALAVLWSAAAAAEEWRRRRYVGAAVETALAVGWAFVGARGPW